MIVSTARRRQYGVAFRSPYGHSVLLAIFANTRARSGNVGSHLSKVHAPARRGARNPAGNGPVAEIQGKGSNGDVPLPGREQPCEISRHWVGQLVYIDGRAGKKNQLICYGFLVGTWPLERKPSACRARVSEKMHKRPCQTRSP